MSETTDSIEDAESETERSNENEYELPGRLTVCPPDDVELDEFTTDDVPPFQEYVCIELSTPLQDKSYLIPVSGFECGLHPTPTNASHIRLTDTTLETIFPLENDQYLCVSRSLKQTEQTITLHDEIAPSPAAHEEENTDVVWVAPKTDAAIIEE